MERRHCLDRARGESSSSSMAWWPPACVHIRAPAPSTEAECGCSAGAFPTLGDAAGSPAYGASGHAREQAAACRGALAFAFGLLGLLWSCYLAASDDKGAKPPGVSSRPRLPP